MKTLQREFIEVLATETNDVELVKKCSEIANNHAIEFAKWCVKWRVDSVHDTEVGILYNYGGVNTQYTMQQLLEIYLTEKQK